MTNSKLFEIHFFVSFEWHLRLLINDGSSCCDMHVLSIFHEILVIGHAAIHIVHTILYKLDFTVGNSSIIGLMKSSQKSTTVRLWVRNLFDHQKHCYNDFITKINFLVLMAEGIWLVVVVVVPHSLYLARFSQVMRFVDCVS